MNGPWEKALSCAPLGTDGFKIKSLFDVWRRKAPRGCFVFIVWSVSSSPVCCVFTSRGHPGWLPSSQAALTPRKGAEPQLLPGGPKQSAASPSKLPTCGQRQGRGWGSLRWKFRVQRVWIWGSQGTLSWSSCLCPHILVCSEEPLGQVHSL